MDAETARRQVLESARALFGERGVQAVGMDAVRTASGVSLKRLYQLFPSKETLVEEVLRRRDQAVREGIAAHAQATGADTPYDRVLDVFDYLADWFAQPGFRGCVFINAFGELGGTSDGVTDIARTHKAALRDHFADLTAQLGAPDATADHLALLANGAMAVAGINGSPEAAHQARDAARILLDAATGPAPGT
ncbi:TetR/AcrR family transcriptional regulator [Streptomyces uncialis]|uniref:TetR/AcrR family transcriptional regulator n=1 Tax=Streptomyces uncialis TaxID=1048205 RepID=UPI002E3466D8|nr:TetR/AcrR family transcriptional regulator [Streptomyces uncialis]